MKRSRALEIIDEQYSQFVEDWLKFGIELLDNNEEVIKNFKPLNERILSALEKEGMLPPFTYLKTLGKLDTAWELENEKDYHKSEDTENKKTSGKKT